MIAAYFKGWTTVLKHPILLLLKYAMNLIAAFIIARPIMRAIRDDFAFSTASLEQFDPILAGEFLKRNVGMLETVSWYGWIGMALFALLSIFTTGGILHVYAVGGFKGPSAFMNACMRHVVPLAVSLIAAVAFFIALYAPLGMVENDIIKHLDDPAAGLLFKNILTVGADLWLILALVWSLSIYDLTRTEACRSGNPFTAFFKAVVFSLQRFFASKFLWLLYAAGPPTLYFLAKFIPSDAFGNWWLILTGQGFILFRVANGLAGLAGQHHLQRSDAAKRSSATGTEGAGEAAHPIVADSIPPAS